MGLMVNIWKNPDFCGKTKVLSQKVGKLAVDIENMWKSKDGSVRKPHGNENSPLFASWIKRDLTLSADDFPHVRHVEPPGYLCRHHCMSMSSWRHLHTYCLAIEYFMFVEAPVCSRSWNYGCDNSHVHSCSMFTVWKQRFLIDPLLRMRNLPGESRHEDDG